MNHQKLAMIVLVMFAAFVQLAYTQGGDAIVTAGLPYSIPQYPTKQEKEAILAARKIARELGGNVTLNLLVSPDNVADFEPFYPEWERETGIRLKTFTVPWPDWFKELMDISITRSRKYDVLMVCPKWIPDLAEAKVFAPFNAYINKYKPEITDPTSPNRVLDGLAAWAKYKGTYYFFMSDTDVATLFLRKDWLEDAGNKERFKNKYGYALDKPKTLEELHDQIEFFHDPSKERYGFVAGWDLMETVWEFYSRFLSQKKGFFDDQMHPNINSAEAVKALDEMKDLLKYAMPGTLEWDFGRSIEAYAGGKPYCILTMTAAQGLFENPELSKVVGKVTYAPQPGRMIAGELVNPQPQDWGWGYAVSQYSKQKELAYLYCQWMSGAAMNARIALTIGGWYDVAKVSNYDEKAYPQIRRKNGGIYMDGWMETQKWQVEHCFPALAMRGGEEYLGVISEGISAVLNGAKESQVALDEVAKKWEQITERYGRKGQIESWNSLKATYSAPVKKWLGYK